MIFIKNKNHNMFHTRQLVNNYVINDMSDFLNKDEIKAINSLVKLSFYDDLFLDDELSSWEKED